MNKKFHYTYKITNLNPLTPKKYYIGLRSCDCLPENDISYLSSCKPLLNDIKLYGVLNFNKEILHTFNTREDALFNEIQLHEYYDVSHNDEFYNQVKQTSKKFDCSGIHLSQLEKDKRKQAMIDYFSRTKKDLSGSNNPMYGKSHTTKSREKISKNHINVSGKNNPAAKTFKLISPNGEVFIVTGSIIQFCKDHNLTYNSNSFNRFINNGIMTIGRNKGWSAEYIIS